MLQELKHAHRKQRSGFNILCYEYIPEIEKRSGLISKANKGALGFSYPIDSVFHADIEKWSDYFDCR